VTQYFSYKKFTLIQAPRHTRVLITAFNAVVFLALLVSLLNYWDKTGMTPAGIKALYRGNEDVDLAPGEAMLFEKTFRELLDATHPHLFGQGVLLFILSHIVALTGLSQRRKIAIYLVSFGAMLFDAALPWLIRYVSAELAPLQIVSILTLTAAFMAQLWFPVREMWFMRGKVPASPTLALRESESESDAGDEVPERKRPRGRRRYRGRRNGPRGEPPAGSEAPQKESVARPGSRDRS
jgi:hypothetical protein